MRTSERLRGLRDWAKRELCDGREMKAPPSDMDITRFVTQEPRCYLGWAPTRPDQTGVVPADPSAVCPGILIMPSTSRAKYVEEKRFDRFSSVHRVQELGQELSVSMLFSVYEPGVRLPGFVTMDAGGRKSIDMTKIMEGTENGLFTLTNWMDDCVQRLLGQKFIPHTDLFFGRGESILQPVRRAELHCGQAPHLLRLCQRVLQGIRRGKQQRRNQRISGIKRGGKQNP